MYRCEPHLCASLRTMDRPPPLEFTDPPCPVCKKTTKYRNGRLWCDHCLASWKDGAWADSRWERGDLPRCESVRPDPGPIVRCVLHADHARVHRSVSPRCWWPQ